MLHIFLKIYILLILILFMVSNKSVSHFLLNRNLMDLFSGYQVFHWKNPPFFCNNLRNSLRCSSVKLWHLFFNDLFKYDFSYLAYTILPNSLLEVWTCSDSNIFFTYALIKYSLSLVLPVFKSFGSYVLKSIMGVVDPFKGPSPSFLTCSEILKLNPNYINR